MALVGGLSPIEPGSMLASFSRRLGQVRVAKNVAMGPQSGRSLPNTFKKSRAATLATLSRRSYAMMSYTDAYIAADYKAEPTVTLRAILRTDMSAQGKRYSTELRSKSKLIPGVVTRGASGKPIMIEMDPRIIHVLMKGPTTRFLGRRYILDIEGLERLEVIPQNLDVEPVGYYPLAVSFAAWHPKIVPKPRLLPHVHTKFFEPLIEFPPVKEQQKQREEGTYVYKRFMANTIQKEVGTPTRPKANPKAGASL